MSKKILYIGGTGTISYACIHEAVKAGQDVTVFNRGKSGEALPDGVRLITGDMNDDAAYGALANEKWDAVCQFLAFTTDQVKRDVGIFKGATDQYVFISSASAYAKPVDSTRVTEETPLINPYWEYSRNKAACEDVLKSSGMPYTIVRPSHTLRHKLPNPFGDEGTFIHRIKTGKPIVVQGDGTSLWTITRAEDFAKPFVNLTGNPAAVNDVFHITGDVAFTWNEITRAIAENMGMEAKLCHVATDSLIGFEPDWEGPLLGDKSHCALFDNSKVKRVAGDFSAETDINKVLAGPVAGAMSRVSKPDEALDALFDRIVDWAAKAGS